MTQSEQKTFKVICANCKQPFTIRRALSRPDADETAEVVVNCPYCGEAVVITVPGKYVPEDHLVRGLKSVSRGR